MARPPPAGPRAPTLVGAVGVRLVAVVPAVVVAVAGPVLRDAAPAVALELGAGAGVAAARLVTVVPTVIVWGAARREEASRGSARDCLCDPSVGSPLPPPHSPSQPTPPPHPENKKQKRHRNCIDCRMHHGPRGGAGGGGASAGGPSRSLRAWGWGQDAFLSPLGSVWEQGSACLGERKGISPVREGQRWAEYR